MEEEQKKSGWTIWICLSPIYFFLVILLVKWINKVESGSDNPSKNEYGAFNASEGKIKKRGRDDYNPDLTDIGYGVRYRSGKAKPGSPQVGGPRPQAAPTLDEEYMGMGSRKGFLTYAVGRIMNDPKEVAALFNNSQVVKGFMGRSTVKAALGSPQGLQNYLKNTTAVNNFLSSGTVQAALNNPAVVNAFATSGMAKAILASPGVQGLMQNPEALTELTENNPQVMQLLSNPNVRNALRNNPQTAGPAAGLGGGVNSPQK